MIVTLVVIVVVDQLPASLFSRFEDLYTQDGFGRMVQQGAWFTNCEYRHALTLTGPGHATVLTGATADTHGIVGNYMLNRTPDGLRRQECVTDLKHRIIGARTKRSAGVSPLRLRAPTLGDRLKKAYPRSRVGSCSLKGRAAVLMGGRFADAAVWWERMTDGGGFATSSYYATEPPAWLEALNASSPADAWLGQQWTRLLPAAEYAKRCRADAAAYELGQAIGVGNQFPHECSSSHGKYSCVLASPSGNELVFEAANNVIAALSLGQRGERDLLCISLSSNDEVGHYYGPYSHEVMDITLRTDRQLAAFFESLDATVGLGRCIIAVTADHGAVMMPEYGLKRGLAAGRCYYKDLSKDLEERLVARFGATGDKYINLLQFPWVYLNNALLQSRGATTAQVRAVLADYVGKQPGLAAAFHAEDIVKPDFASDDLRELVKRSYCDTAGDVFLHITKYWYYDRIETGHGSAWDYDRQVPLLLMGPGIRPGRYEQPAAPSDLVPTLAHLLELPQLKMGPGQGRVLKEALLPTHPGARIPASPQSN